MFKRMVALLAAAGALGIQAIPAAACGGLVAPNGAIRLSRATTLVAWHDGVERYLTSFSYEGSGVKDFGWIVPLPAIPDKVEEGGGWTLQRLFRETHPVPVFAELSAGAGTANAAAPAIVIEQVQVRALDVTVLKGSGQAIVDWCAQNHFLLNNETKGHLMVYAGGSPVFMAAKYNVARAEATRQLSGDGAPVLITMRIPHPWVPLEVLANGVSEVDADLYFLTDRPITTTTFDAVTGQTATGQFVRSAPGLAIQIEKPMNDALYHDLSTDKNMGWVQRDSWLTYMTLSAPAQTVTYDLGISPAGVVMTAPFGTPPMQVVDGRPAAHRAPYGGPTLPVGTPWLALIILWLAAVTAIAAATWRLRRLSDLSAGGYLQVHS